MASYVDIANLAISYLGEDDQLRSPDDDTHVARTVKAAWDLTRQAALRDHPYSFARTRIALSAAADDVAPIGWGYRFPLPPLCLRVIQLADWPGRDDFDIEDGALLWDSPGPLRIRYIRDVVDPSYWDALFVDAFARRLAWQIADRITGDRNRKADAWTAYKEALAAAKRVDALQDPRIENDEPGAWETARLGWDSGCHHDGWQNWGPYQTA